jgi:hypothetical protein
MGRDSLGWGKGLSTRTGALQRGIRRPRLSVGLFRTALQRLACLRAHHRHLLVARCKSTYNHHRAAPLLRALVALSSTKSTRSFGAGTVISSAAFHLKLLKELTTKD